MTYETPCYEICQWVIDRYSTDATKPRRCTRHATIVVREYGRSERDYCPRHAALAIRDNEGVRI